MKTPITILNVVCFFIICNFGYAQNKGFNTIIFPEKLKENANSIVVNQQIDVKISSQDNFSIKKNKTICVLNEYGIRNIDAQEYFDKSTKINAIEVVVYNYSGKEIKRIKRKDFRNQSIADGFSMLTDGRTLFLDYTPTEYPFTIVYTSETESTNTAFIPEWRPIDDFYESVLKSSITITYPENLGFKYKEFNFEDKNILKNQTTNTISFTTENLMAVKKEEFSPSFQKMIPYVKFGLEKFNLEGVQGIASSWEKFGLWMYNNLLSGSDELPIETQQKIKTLVGNETDPIKKAKIVYQYVQDKTRYVSIQLGIGGWKPMLAKDVDRLGYGDCKALSNYTRALLKTVNVTSYYTIVYAGSDKDNLNEDFVSMQGNHAILAIPVNDKLCFLECTSQTTPFGFQGDFTDDRYVLVVKPDKGEIVKTNGFNDKGNKQFINGKYAIDENGNIKGDVVIKSTGIQYDDSYGIEKKSPTDLNDFYKTRFNNINNLKIEKVSFNNNKEQIEFTENLQLSASEYGLINANSIIFPINVFNQSNRTPQRYRTRNNSFEITRGFLDEDEIQITIPANYVLESKPDNLEIKDEFGEYKIEVSLVTPQKIIYKRTLFIKKGFYEKENYENYRKFREKIAKADNSKIIINKKQS